MAGPASPVGDNPGGDLHDGFPVRIGHLGHQHLALFKLINLLCAGEDMDGSSADLLSDASPLSQDPPLLFQYIGLQDIHVALRFDRLRPRLKDEKLLRDAVLCPFDIHGHVVTRPL